MSETSCDRAEDQCIKRDECVIEKMWSNIADRVLKISLVDSYLSVRAMACTIYSNVSSKLHEKLGPSFHEQAMECISRGIRDVAPAVRAASVRTLGIYIFFPHLLLDHTFVDQCSKKIFLLLDDPVVNVRVRASWSLANMCDALRQTIWCSSELSNHNDEAEIVTEIIIQVLNSCADDDRILCNSVRALGNVAMFHNRHVFSQHISFHLRDGVSRRHFGMVETGSYAQSRSNEITIERAIHDELIGSLCNKSVKTRWNACYALGSVLQNAKFFGVDNMEILDRLCNIVLHDDNFKVRIQAAIAICECNDLHNRLSRIWNCVSEAMDKVFKEHSTVGYREYKHVKTLQGQLQNMLLHLVHLTDVDIEDEVVVYTVAKFHNSLLDSLRERHTEALSADGTDEMANVQMHILKIIAWLTAASKTIVEETEEEGAVDFRSGIETTITQLKYLQNIS